MALETVLRGVPDTWEDLAKRRPPAPDPGCRTCESLQLQIDALSDPRGDEYDPSKALDLRIEMSRHQVSKAAS